jgi:hypothetical protein
VDKGSVVNIDTLGASARQVGAASIGIPSIINAGFIDAIDIWGPHGARGDVCFAEKGRLLFKDSTTMPHLLVWLDSYQRNGMTCAQIDRPGTLILIAGEPSPSTAPVEPTERQDPYLIADSLDSMVDIENCEVTANVNLNFRAGPAQQRLGSFRGGSRAAVVARTANWFKVLQQGAQGWISAHYVTVRGDCD